MEAAGGGQDAGIGEGREVLTPLPRCCRGAFRSDSQDVEDGAEGAEMLTSAEKQGCAGKQRFMNSGNQNIANKQAITQASQLGSKQTNKKIYPP